MIYDEKNALVAEHLFDLHTRKLESGWQESEDGNEWWYIRDYIGDVTLLPKLLDKLSSVGRWSVRMDQSGAYVVNIRVNGYKIGEPRANLTIIRDVLPHAICVAALIGMDAPGAFEL